MPHERKLKQYTLNTPATINNRQQMDRKFDNIIKIKNKYYNKLRLESELLKSGDNVKKNIS